MVTLKSLNSVSRDLPGLREDSYLSVKFHRLPFENMKLCLFSCCFFFSASPWYSLCIVLWITPTRLAILAFHFSHLLLLMQLQCTISSPLLYSSQLSSSIPVHQNSLSCVNKLSQICLLVCENSPPQALAHIPTEIKWRMNVIYALPAYLLKVCLTPDLHTWRTETREWERAICPLFSTLIWVTGVFNPQWPCRTSESCSCYCAASYLCHTHRIYSFPSWNSALNGVSLKARKYFFSFSKP